MKRVLIVTVTLSLVALSCSTGNAGSPATNNAGSQTGASAGNAATSGYSLVAWTELGMHCIDGKDYSIFSILPPYNVIHAQLFKKGEPPVPVTTGVTITYQATPDTTGSVNSKSAPKTNFCSLASS